MEQREIRFQKMRDLSQVISDSFDFLKQERRALARVILIYVLPFVVVYAGAQVYFQRNILIHFDLTNPESIMANIGPFYLNLLVFMFFGMFIYSLLAGTYFTYIEAYLKKGKNNFSLTDISGHFFHNSLLALGAALVFSILSFLGIMFCILPGILVANSLSLMIVIAVIRKKGIAHSFMHSWALVRTQWWNTFLINLIGILIVYAVGMLFSVPLMIAGFAGSFSAATAETGNYPNWYWLLVGVSSAASTLLMIIPFTFQAFQYFNIEERVNPKRKVNAEDLTP